MYDSFLELCGFERNEIQEDLPRIRKAFDKLEITSEDIEEGEERVRENFDIELLGMRKILRLFIKELVNLMLAEDEKEIRLYTVMPTINPDIIGAAMQASNKVYAGFPDFLLIMVAGAIFGKLAPIQDAAEEHMLTRGAAHCSCNQTRLGCQVLELLPRPDLLLSWGHFCDEVPKVDELLHEFFDIPVVIVNRCQDEDWTEYPEPNPRAVEFYTAELKKALAKTSETIGVEISEDLFRQTLMTSMMYYGLVAQIGELVVDSDPLIISPNDILYALWLYFLGVAPENVQARMDAVNILYSELKERKEKGVGILPKGAPRVLHCGFPSLVDPSVIKLMERLGLAIPVMEAQLWYPDAQFLPSATGVDLTETDPCKILAMTLLAASFLHVTSGREEALLTACKRYDIDAVFALLHYSCRPYGNDGIMLKGAIKEELGLPTLLLEGDIFDPRIYTREQLRTRLESFAELVKASKRPRG